jgi:hypothetical protein
MMGSGHYAYRNFTRQNHRETDIPVEVPAASRLGTKSFRAVKRSHRVKSKIKLAMIYRRNTSLGSLGKSSKCRFS